MVDAYEGERFPFKNYPFQGHHLNQKPKSESAGASGFTKPAGAPGVTEPSGNPSAKPSNFMRSDKSRIVCNFCKKTGHVESSCFKKDPSKKQDHRKPKPIRSVGVRKCLFCGDTNHRLGICPHMLEAKKLFKTNRVSVIPLPTLLMVILVPRV